MIFLKKFEILIENISFFNKIRIPDTYVPIQRFTMFLEIKGKLINKNKKKSDFRHLKKNNKELKMTS